LDDSIGDVSHQAKGAFNGLNIAVNFWFANMTAPIDEASLLEQSSSTEEGAHD